MTPPHPTAMNEWTGHTALAVRLRPRAALEHDPVPDAPVVHLGPTDSPRPPMFLLTPGQWPVEPLMTDRATFEMDGRHLVNLVKLSFGDVDRQLAAELMPNAIRRSLQLEVWCAADAPAYTDGPHEPQEWDHYTVWDVSPLVARWRLDSASGTHHWEFIGAVNRPLRAIEPVMVEVAQRHQGQMPLFSVLRGGGPIPQLAGADLPLTVWPGPGEPFTQLHPGLPG